MSIMYGKNRKQKRKTKEEIIMVENNQELIKKDLVYILQLNTKTNYKNPAEVQKIRNYALQRNLFKTTLGQRYMKRLEMLISGVSASNNCVLCNKALDNSSLVCTSCLTKYKLPPAKKENIITQPQKENNTEQRGSVTSGQTSAVQHAVNREQNIAAPPKAKTKKKISKKTIIIALVVLTIIGALISEDEGTSGGEILDNDLVYMIGLTESQAEKQYGKPNFIMSKAETFASYDEGFAYITNRDGVICTVSVDSGDRKLLGIAIGDDGDKVSETTKENGFVLSSQEILIENGQRILVQTYKKDNFTFTIYINEDIDKVIFLDVTTPH